MAAIIQQPPVGPPVGGVGAQAAPQTPQQIALTAMLTSLWGMTAVGTQPTISHEFLRKCLLLLNHYGIARPRANANSAPQAWTIQSINSATNGSIYQAIMMLGKKRWNSLFLQDMVQNPSAFPWATATFIDSFMGHFFMKGTTPFTGWLGGVPPPTVVAPPAQMIPVPPTAPQVVTMAPRVSMNLPQVHQTTAIVADLKGLEQTHQEELSQTLLNQHTSELTVSSSTEEQRHQEQLTTVFSCLSKASSRPDADASVKRLAKIGKLIIQSFETWKKFSYISGKLLKVVNMHRHAYEYLIKKLVEDGFQELSGNAGASAPALLPPNSPFYKLQFFLYLETFANQTKRNTEMARVFQQEFTAKNAQNGDRSYADRFCSLDRHGNFDPSKIHHCARCDSMQTHTTDEHYSNSNKNKNGNSYGYGGKGDNNKDTKKDQRNHKNRNGKRGRR